MAELLGVPFSPWTEKARFSLDARRVSYRFRHYQPLLGEPALRVKLRRLNGRVSVPVLTDDEGRVHDGSLAIARRGDTQGHAPSLFPTEHEATILEWSEVSERALAAGRALSLRRVLDDPAALLELTPPALRKLGPIATSISSFGVRRTIRKYDSAAATAAAHRDALARALESLRTALAGRPTLFDRALTFADIAMAQVLAFIEPPKTGLRIGAANRRAFSDAELRVQFADLVAWRDALYARHRG